MPTQAEAAEIVKNGYERGDFTAMFPLMTEDYEHLSFWVLDVIRGKERAIDYYTGKGKALRAAPKEEQITGKLVRLVKAPDKVRPKGVYRGGVRMLEDPAFLHRQDAGKVAVLIEQYISEEKELIHTLAVPTVNGDGLLRQVLIGNPDFYEWEEL